MSACERPCELAFAWLTHFGHTTSNWPLAMIGASLHEIGSVGTCLGIIGAVTLAVNSGLMRRVRAGVASVGRLALSNYLLQTVVSTFLMYWWGLGWFGDFTRIEQIGLVVVIYLGQVVVSVIWLRFFRMGPVEWVWRTLTYLKPQPILRRL